MCGRYTVTDPEGLEKRFDARFKEGKTPRYNGAPSQTLPAILPEEKDVIAMLIWGLVPPWDKKSSRRLINARSETAGSKKTFARAVRHRRCLVLADGFYEWKSENGKEPYWIGLEGRKPFAFAGIYYPPQKEEERPQFIILTTKPNEKVAPIHDRMPVILSPEKEEKWMDLSLDWEECSTFLEPYPEGEMELYAVSRRVNRADCDDPSLIKPAQSKKQGEFDWD